MSATSTIAAVIVAATVQTSAAALSVTEERERIERAGQLGRALYDHDRAAWVASDALTGRLPRDRLTGTGGWVVEPDAGQGLVVTFYRGQADVADVLFVARVLNDKVIDERVVDGPVALTPAQLRLARAREAAVAEAERRHLKPCTPRPFNTVVLAPNDPRSPTMVYLLSAQVENGAWPIGGHYRLTVGADGEVVSSRPYSASCLTMRVPSETKGKPPSVLFVTHLLDPVPTEMHVFTSYAARLPLIVGTRDRRLWSVEGARIAPAGTLDAAKPRS